MNAPAVAAAVKNPYPGLRPFEPDEFESFFGRDRQINELLMRLRDHRFVAVVGLSGSGKSSLTGSRTPDQRGSEMEGGALPAGFGAD